MSASVTQDGYLSDDAVRALAGTGDSVGRAMVYLADAFGDVVARTSAERGPGAAALEALRMLRPFSEATLQADVRRLVEPPDAGQDCAFDLLNSTFRDCYESAVLALGGAL